MSYSNTRRGFTLIELLVVVLIVGILTAVAVPQYRKAVLKSRFSTLMPLAKNLWEGNEIYYLNNGMYADSTDELDVSAPADSHVQATVGDEEQHQYVRVSNPDLPNRITIYQKHSPNFPEETHCEALLDDDLANWLCKDSLQGTFVGNKYGYAVYTLSPTAVGTLVRKYNNLKVSGDFTLTDGDVCEATLERSCQSTGWQKAITFTNGAKCVANSINSTQWYGCEHDAFTSGGICIATSVANRGCVGGTYDGSYCVGNAPNNLISCHGQFNNYSICYANASGACAGGSTYDDTSCCYGSGCSQNRCEDNDYWKDHLDEIPPAPTYP